MTRYIKKIGIASFIFARGGSQGIKNKNIVKFNGKHLIGWAIEQALEIKEIDKVIVSTDSKKIAKISQSYGAEIPFIRPTYLANNKSSELLSWKHALRNFKQKYQDLPEMFISLPCTSPLRKKIDIKKCINLFKKSNADMVVCITETNRNPYFNMVKINKSGYLDLAINTKKKIHRRQDADKIYDMTTIAYVANPNYILNAKHIFDGNIKSILIPYERSIDIDNMHDLNIARYLHKKNVKK